MKNNELIFGVGSSAYETPSVSVLNCQNEGLLCVSGDFTLGGGGTYGDDDINDNGEY